MSFGVRKVLAILIPIFLFIGLGLTIGYSTWTFITIDRSAEPEQVVYTIVFKNSNGSNELYRFENLENNSYFEFPKGVDDSFIGWTCNSGATRYDSYSYHHLDEFNSYITDKILTFKEYCS